jgi:flavin-dependent dehydrogenase
MRYDVAIVGAGPAGAATALLLARAGLRVALLDRSEFPRGKACGECLSPPATRVLERLGILADVLALNPARLTGWRIHANDGTSFHAGFDAASNGDPLVRTALALPRTLLDASIAGAALAAGADLLEGHRAQQFVRSSSHVQVGGRTSSGGTFTINARLLIGADGLRSAVAARFGFVKRAPRLRKVSLTAHVRGITGASQTGEMHLADGMCCGLAPVSGEADPLFNLTIVANADRFGRDISGRPHAFFQTALQRFPMLHGRIQEAALPIDPEALLASGPFDRPMRAAVAERVALIGDAAGYYDPFTGQGIYQALAAAELLAKSAQSALAKDDCTASSLQDYARAHTTLMREARTLQRGIEMVLQRPALARYCIRRLADAPVAAEHIIAATGDMCRPRSLLSTAVVFSFLAARPGLESSHC